MKKLKYCKNYQMWHRHKVSRCCCKNGADKLAGCKVVTKLQFIKNAIKCSKVKLYKMTYAYLILLHSIEIVCFWACNSPEEKTIKNSSVSNNLCTFIFSWAKIADRIGMSHVMLSYGRNTWRASRGPFYRRYFQWIFLKIP